MKAFLIVYGAIAVVSLMVGVFVHLCRRADKHLRKASSLENFQWHEFTEHGPVVNPYKYRPNTNWPHDVCGN